MNYEMRLASIRLHLSKGMVIAKDIWLWDYLNRKILNTLVPIAPDIRQPDKSALVRPFFIYPVEQQK